MILIALPGLCQCWLICKQWSTEACDVEWIERSLLVQYIFSNPLWFVFLFQTSIFLSKKVRFTFSFTWFSCKSSNCFWSLNQRKHCFFISEKFNVCTFDWPALISSRRRRRKGKSSETYHERVFGYPLGQFISIALERCSWCHSGIG